MTQEPVPHGRTLHGIRDDRIDNFTAIPLNHVRHCSHHGDAYLAIEFVCRKIPSFSGNQPVEKLIENVVKRDRTLARCARLVCNKIT